MRTFGANNLSCGVITVGCPFIAEYAWQRVLWPHQHNHHFVFFILKFNLKDNYFDSVGCCRWYLTCSQNRTFRDGFKYCKSGKRNLLLYKEATYKKMKGKLRSGKMTYKLNCFRWIWKGLTDNVTFLPDDGPWESLVIPQVIKVYHLGTMNICIKLFISDM